MPLGYDTGCFRVVPPVEENDECTPAGVPETRKESENEQTTFDEFVDLSFDFYTLGFRPTPFFYGTGVLFY